MNNSLKAATKPADGDQSSAIASVGQKVSQIEVQIGPQFLNLFSEHLYSSPNKAFEELVSNSWDAEASQVYINVPEDLVIPEASIWVLDNGKSMDENGLSLLWSVGHSEKREKPAKGRKPIGKFGVGKLATYLLANELTYICCAQDGKTRLVTMDYRNITKRDSKKLHIDPIPLDVRCIETNELDAVLTALDPSGKLKNLISVTLKNGQVDTEFLDEFGGNRFEVPSQSNTWTLAVLSSLKPSGRDLQAGWIRRLLRTSLPLGNTISIYFNEEKLTASKTDLTVHEKWVLGPGLGIDSLDLSDGSKINIKEVAVPYPHIIVDELGEVSGNACLYKEKISGGKSDDIASSNGIFVNVFGKVIKPEDPYFGLENLSHSSWARFRATLRADGLDEVLAVNREGLAHSRQLLIVRALAMKLFNKARQSYNAALSGSWPDIGSVLTEKWGGIPFEPLQRVVAESFLSPPEANDFIALPKPDKLQATQVEWSRAVTHEPGSIIKDVVIGDLGSTSKIAQYDVATRRVIINRNHPFSEEHSSTSEEERVLRDVALVDLLTDAFMVDIGISELRLNEIRDYKDRALRLVAQVRRRSAAQIASLLNNATDHAKGFERIVGDALEYLGFSVDRMGQSGEPEGVALAVVTPAADSTRVAYKFTYDAKSSQSGKAKTSNLNIAGLSRHRKDHGADYTLVIAPNYEIGSLEQEAREHLVTPITASDLARLVMATIGYGPFSLVEFKGLFNHYDPKSVSSWVDGQIQSMQSKRLLSLATLIQALTNLTKDNPDRPDTLHCSQIADACKSILNDTQYPTRNVVADAIRGLSYIVPNMISISAGQDVFLNASPIKFKNALTTQLAQLPDDLKFGITRD